MSIVVAVQKEGRTVMAADTLTVFGDTEAAPPDNSRTNKIYRLGSSVFGFTGWAVYDDIINDMVAGDETPVDLESSRAIFTFFLRLWRQLHDDYPFVNDQSQSKESPFGDLDTSFLIANRAGIFKVSSDLGVTRFNQYYAIGSGSEYALGAIYNLYPMDLDVESLARRAAATAIQFDVNCGGEVDVLAIE